MRTITRFWHVTLVVAVMLSGQGYPNEGADHRLLSGLGWLQRAFIIPAVPVVGRILFDHALLTWHKSWPPFVMIEYPVKGKFRQIRLGWTYRRNEGYYIPGMAFKLENGLEPDYL